MNPFVVEYAVFVATFFVLVFELAGWRIKNRTKNTKEQNQRD